MKEQAKTLLEKFADPKILESKTFVFKVYALEKNTTGGFVNPRLGISYPSPFIGNSYFIAEVKVNLGSSKGFMVYNHMFQFEIKILEAELLKIDSEWAQSLVLPNRITNALNDCYHKIAPHLKDYNEKADDMVEIAQILYLHRGGSVGPTYDI